MLRDIYLGLEHLNSNDDLKIKNYSIKVLVSGSQDIMKRYPEEATKMDPFRKKLLDGLSKALNFNNYSYVFE